MLQSFVSYSHVLYINIAWFLVSSFKEWEKVRADMGLGLMLEKVRAGNLEF